MLQVWGCYLAVRALIDHRSGTRALLVILSPSPPPGSPGTQLTASRWRPPRDPRTRRGERRQERAKFLGACWTNISKRVMSTHSGPYTAADTRRHMWPTLPWSGKRETEVRRFFFFSLHLLIRQRSRSYVSLFTVALCVDLSEFSTYNAWKV